MKPIEFPEAIKQLQPSGKEYSENVESVKPLPVWSDGEQCVSKWRISWRERLALLFHGTLWVQLLTSKPTQPPIAFWTGKRFFSQESR